MSILRVLALALAAAAALPSAARAQGFPTQRITIVVPFAAGSVTDIMARILSDEMARRWAARPNMSRSPTASARPCSALSLTGRTRPEVGDPRRMRRPDRWG